MNITIALAMAAAAASGATVEQREPTRWHVEVRDLPSDHVPDSIDPVSGTLVAAFDLDRGTTPKHGGETVPYMDVESLHLTKGPDDRVRSEEVRMLNTGIEIGVGGTADAPVLSAEDVVLTGFSKHEALGTSMNLPMTSVSGITASLTGISGPTVVGAYANMPSKPSTVRFYVVSRM